MSLRSVTSDNFVIIDITGVPDVIGEVDFPSALTIVHEKAIYMHGGSNTTSSISTSRNAKPT